MCVCDCTCRGIQYTIQFRYLLSRSSNMAVVDVEVPSGYIYTGWRFADEFVSVTLAIETAAMSYHVHYMYCLLYTSPSPRDATLSRMPSSA